MTALLNFLMAVSLYVGFALLIGAGVYALLKLLTSRYFNLDE